MSIGESIRNGRLDLRNMEYWMDKSKFVGESETNRVTANAVNNLEWAEVGFGEFSGRSGRLDMFRQEEDLLAWGEVGWRNATLVRSSLVALLS